MRFAFVLLAALATSIGTPADAERLVLDPQTTTIGFTLSATGHTVRGTLALEQGALQFPVAGGAASGRIVIDARSAATGSKGRDRTMHEEVLESERFPQFVFIPRQLRGSVALQGASEAVLEGDLEIHGATHAVSLPTTISIDGTQVTASATLTIPFVEWGMHDPSMLFLRVAKEVEITLGARGRLISDQLASEAR